jgi:tetratricopeptide (TPR) repeat protein/transcriptional regulator with XRE-family HTH domain
LPPLQQFHFTSTPTWSRKTVLTAGQPTNASAKGGRKLQTHTHSFGYWLRRRRRALDLTQEALAQRVSCSHFSIRKIEADERRPSRGLAERLAKSLAIPEDERSDFLDAARAVRATNALRVDAIPVEGERAAAPGPPGTLKLEPRAGTESDVTPFVGRAHEYQLLTDFVLRLSDGSGHAVLIEGEPGIGKSRLMREIARFADAHDLPVITTNCYEIERAIPYQPIINLMSRALDGLSPHSLRNLAPVSLAELAVLVPEVAERVPNLPTLSTDFPEARQARLPRAVGQLLSVWRGGRGCIVMVDDIQWADDASVQVLHYLARQCADGPMLLICAYRGEEVDSDERFARLIDSLRREAGARRISLARLDPQETSSLVAVLADSSHGAAGLAERLHRETEGNPFFLISILQSLSEGEIRVNSHGRGEPGLLPDALRAAVRVRLTHLPKNLRSLLESAAVLGRRFDFDTLLDATGEPEARLLDALEVLVKRRLMREEGDGGVYDFSHDKVREVVYHDIGGGRRRVLHRTVAESLERRGAADVHERVAELAEHFERAQVWSKAMRYLLLAANRSQHMFALRDALHWLDRAVALSDAHPKTVNKEQRLEIFSRRGAARILAGQTQGAVADFRRVVEAARAGGERDKTRDALVRLGMAYRRADAYEEAAQCLDEALAESLAMKDARRAADTLYHLGTVTWSNGVNDRAIGFHQQAVEICEREGFGDLVAVQAYHGRGEAHYANSEPTAAIECFNRSLDLARGIGDKSYESENLQMIGHACVGTKGLGDYRRAIASFEAALQIARAADLQWHMGPSLLGLDHARACTGRYGEAWSGLRTTLQRLEELRQPRYQLIAYDFLGHLLLDLGYNDLALEQLQRGLTLARDTGIGFWRAGIEALFAVAKTRLGHTDVEPALLEQTGRNSERHSMVGCIEGLAEIAHLKGDARRCRAHADELLGLAASNGLREHEASARRWRGEACLAEGEYLQAEAELSRAAAQAVDIGRVSLQRDAQIALARLFEAQGRRDAAQHHRATARRIASDISESLGSTSSQMQ